MTRQLSGIGVGVVCLDRATTADVEPGLSALAEAHGCVVKAVVGWRRDDPSWIFTALEQVHIHSASAVFALHGDDLGDYARALTGVADIIVGGPGRIRTYAYEGYEGYVPRPGLIEVPQRPDARRPW
ncbi:hypothetical protein IU501_11010 [Nocardia otitidiscaviarum]|uniref:hypothetical protein n=1 Tax=Nocardia otitidiscaviarum TaxID=1823 RepID=UPI0018948106|nr:hypothetical protein [Nocardia otitidiscaviarum]MBF6133529.1 hypothetical protein [Nocardia otitidiscaviarum]